MIEIEFAAGATLERVDQERGTEFVLLGLPVHPSVRRTNGAKIRGEIFPDLRHRGERSINRTHSRYGHTRRRGGDVHQPNGPRNGSSK